MDELPGRIIGVSRSARLIVMSTLGSFIFQRDLITESLGDT